MLIKCVYEPVEILYKHDTGQTYAKVYPNEKARKSKEVKKLLKAEQYAFQTGDRISLKRGSLTKTATITYKYNFSRIALNKYGTTSS